MGYDYSYRFLAPRIDTRQTDFQREYMRKRRKEQVKKTIFTKEGKHKTHNQRRHRNQNAVGRFPEGADGVRDAKCGPYTLNFRSEGTDVNIPRGIWCGAVLPETTVNWVSLRSETAGMRRCSSLTGMAGTVFLSLSGMPGEVQVDGTHNLLETLRLNEVSLADLLLKSFFVGRLFEVMSRCLKYHPVKTIRPIMEVHWGL